MKRNDTIVIWCEVDKSRRCSAFRMMDFIVDIDKDVANIPSLFAQ